MSMQCYKKYFKYPLGKPTLGRLLLTNRVPASYPAFIEYIASITYKILQGNNRAGPRV